MKRVEAHIRLTQAGVDRAEASYMLNYLLEERFCPSSRGKGSKLERIKGVFQGAGIDMDSIEFQPADQKAG